jgi:hypothetical protein
MMEKIGEEFHKKRHKVLTIISAKEELSMTEEPSSYRKYLSGTLVEDIKGCTVSINGQFDTRMVDDSTGEDLPLTLMPRKPKGKGKMFIEILTGKVHCYSAGKWTKVELDKIEKYGRRFLKT